MLLSRVGLVVPICLSQLGPHARNAEGGLYIYIQSYIGRNLMWVYLSSSPAANKAVM